MNSRINSALYCERRRRANVELGQNISRGGLEKVFLKQIRKAKNESWDKKCDDINRYYRKLKVKTEMEISTNTKK